jgi:hypothetical protein
VLIFIECCRKDLKDDEKKIKIGKQKQVNEEAVDLQKILKINQFSVM